VAVHAYHPLDLALLQRNRNERLDDFVRLAEDVERGLSGAGAAPR
jgi:hypothetical protein